MSELLTSDSDYLGPYGGRRSEPKEYEPTPEELEAEARRIEREKVEAIKDPSERLDAMVGSEHFDDEDVRRYLASLTMKRNGVFRRLLGEHKDLAKRLYGIELHEPEEPEPLKTGEEIYGADAYVTVTLPDGTQFQRVASPEELKLLRRQEILSMKDEHQRLQAIARNLDVFD